MSMRYSHRLATLLVVTSAAVLGSGGMIYLIGTTNWVSQDSNATKRLEPTTAVGSNWATMWSEINPNDAQPMPLSYASRWVSSGSSGYWQPALPLPAPNCQPTPDCQHTIDTYLEWDPVFGRFVFVMLDSAPSHNVWFGYSNDSDGSSWTLQSTAALVGGFSSQYSEFLNWDYPSIGVDSGGRIVIGAQVVGTVDNRLFVTVGTYDGSTFSFSQPSPVANAFGKQGRVIGTNGLFEAFLPTLDSNSNTLNRIDRWESPDGSTWTGPNLVVSYQNGPPNQSAQYVGGNPLFYGPYLDARGTANGSWEVVFPVNYAVGSSIYTNIGVCTNFRGCGIIDQEQGDEFMGAGHIASDNSIWVSYKTFASATLLNQIVWYLPQSGQTAGAVAYSTIDPTTWYLATVVPRCSVNCWVEGDYTHIASVYNPSSNFEGASLPFVSAPSSQFALNDVYQNFVQDPPLANLQQLVPHFVPFPLGATLTGISLPVPATRYALPPSQLRPFVRTR